MNHRNQRNEFICGTKGVLFILFEMRRLKGSLVKVFPIFFETEEYVFFI